MKKKLRLQIEKLRVEQFDALPETPVGRGTVRAFETAGHSCGGTNPWDGGCICFDMPGTMHLDITDCC